MSVKELERLEAQAEEAGAFVNDYRVVGFDVAKEVISGVIAERDALTAKLAEMEWQEPVAWMTANREMTSFVNFHDDDLPLFARPVHVEPVNVDFGMRGENMFFQIGNQSFLLDYKPEEQGEFDFMKAMLLSAFSRITHGVKTEIQPVNARLMDALKRAKSALVSFKFIPGEANRWEESDEEDLAAIDDAIETAVLRKNGIEVVE